MAVSFTRFRLYRGGEVDQARLHFYQGLIRLLSASIEKRGEPMGNRQDQHVLSPSLAQNIRHTLLTGELPDDAQGDVQGALEAIRALHKALQEAAEAGHITKKDADEALTFIVAHFVERQLEGVIESYVDSPKEWFGAMSMRASHYGG